MKKVSPKKSPVPKTDLATPADIKTLVDNFYISVRRDDLLAPIFLEKIPGDWQPHLEVMYRFWQSTLLSIPGYTGNPFVKHVDLPIDPDHFARWLSLFRATVDAHFAGPVAEDAKKRAGVMAELFQYKLDEWRERQQFPLV